MRRITQVDIATEFGKLYGSRVHWETGKHGKFWCWDGKSWTPGDDADKEGKYPPAKPGALFV